MILNGCWTLRVVITFQFVLYIWLLTRADFNKQSEDASHLCACQTLYPDAAVAGPL